MKFLKDNAGVIATVALIIAIVGVFTPAGQSLIKSFGGVTNYDEVDATAIKIGGTNGSRLGPIMSGTCNLTSDSSITATTTGTATCTITGLVAGDYCGVEIATTSVALSRAFVNMGAVASADTCTVRLFNMTGGNLVPSSLNGFGSSTPYWAAHPVTSVPGL